MTDAASIAAEGVDPWEADVVPRSSFSLQGLVGDLSAGQRYTTVIAVVLAVLVVVFSRGPVEDDDSFLAGVTGSTETAAQEVGLVPAGRSDASAVATDAAPSEPAAAPVESPLASPSADESPAPAAPEPAPSPAPSGGAPSSPPPSSPPAPAPAPTVPALPVPLPVAAP